MTEKNKVLTEILEGLASISAKMFSFLKSPEEQSTSFSQLYEQVWMESMKLDEWVWLIDLYTEDTGEIFAIFSKEGLLYKSQITLEDSGVSIGELTQVKEVFEPVSNRLLIKRQADGESRWFLIASSNVLNRNASIDSAELFDNLVRRCEETGKYPFVTYYHLDEAMRMGITDWVAREGSLLLASGTFEKENKKAECMQERYAEDPDYWGSSISFFPFTGHMEEIAQGVKVPVYTDGEFYEISFLAEKDACCLFTALKSSGKVTQMNKDLKEKIDKLAGDPELADQFAADVDKANRAIKENSLITRQEGSVETEIVTPAVEEPKVEETSEEVIQTPASEIPEEEKEKEKDPENSEEDEVVVDEELAKDIASMVEKSPSMVSFQKSITDSSAHIENSVKTLQQEFADYRAAKEDQIKKLIDRVSSLEKSEEEKAEQWRSDLPRASRKVVTYRAKESESTEEAETLEDIAKRTLANMK